MAKKYFERRSLATSLLTFLQTQGYNISEVREGYDSDKEIEPPVVVVTFMPTNFREYQMGRGNPLIRRRIQIDCFMENEPRADSITDDIGDYIDENVITVVDNSSNVKAKMISLTETIELEVVPPVLTAPLWRHWRGIIRASYDVQYLEND